MTTINKIINEIDSIEDSIFQFDKELNSMMQKIENISFVGQVDYNNLYMAMLHQVHDKETKKIYSITAEEAEEFYLTHKIENYSGFEPFAWTFWFFNMDKDYVKALVSFKGDIDKRPKENYGIIYNDLKPNVVTKIPRKMIYDTTVFKSGYKDIWLPLKKIIIYGKNNTITTNNFDKKIFYDTATYFGARPQDEGTLLDDFNRPTMKPEIIKIPVKHIPQDIRHDLKALSIMRGTGFKQIDFEGDGYIKEFDNMKDLNSYLYSLINYINSGVEEKLKGQQIETLEKNYFSNKLGFENSEKFYKVKITNFLGKIILEAEVAEMGVYYKLTNFIPKEFIDEV